MNQNSVALPALIVAYVELKKFYEDSLRTRTSPVSRTITETTAELRKRHDTLAVQQPFYNPFLQKVGNDLTEGQKLAMEFRTRFFDLRRRLEDYCRIHDRGGLLSALRQTDVTVGNGQSIIDGLQRHIDLMLIDKSLSPQERVDVWIQIDLPKALREARGGLTQQDLVDDLNTLLQERQESVSLDTYKGWESGRHRPRGNKRLAVEAFIRKRLNSGETPNP